MAEKELSPESVLELREEVLQRVEAVGGRIKRLAIVTVFVSGLLALSYIFEIASPYVTGSTTATVNLRDPLLVAFEVVLTVLALVWLYVGLSDYRFVARLSKSIRKARVLESEIEKEISGNQAHS
jgi:hypothetical protein